MNRQRTAILLVAAVGLLSNAAIDAAPIFNIGFETEDDFATTLVHGQSISSFPRPNRTAPFVPFSADSRLEFGRLVNVSATMIGDDGHLDAAIFDSDPADTTDSGDENLLVGLGNILMLQADEHPDTSLDASHGLMFDEPNDEATHTDRGSIVFDFLRANVHPISIDLIDIDRGVHMELILTDSAGRQRTFDVPTEWTTDITDAPIGYQTLSFETLMPQPAAPNAAGDDATASQDPGFNDFSVRRLEVRILGSSPSAGLDNIVFAIPEPTAGTLAIAAAIGLFCRRRAAAALVGETSVGSFRSARLQAAVDGVLVAAVDGERGLERFLRDLPHGLVVGVGVAVGHEQAVEELEQVPRHAERAEGVDQPLVGDRVVEQRAERRLLAVRAAAADAGVGQVVQRFARPFERRDHVLLVEPGPLVEVAVLALHVVGQLARQQQLQADAGLLQELVVEHRPDEGPHPLDRAGDQVRLVDAIDQHDDAVAAERFQHALELGQQLVAVVGALAFGQRLAVDVAARGTASTGAAASATCGLSTRTLRAIRRGDQVPFPRTARATAASRARRSRTARAS